MLRGDGTKTRHVREQRYENRPACGRRRRNRHTRGHWHANRPVTDFSPCHPELSPCHPERSEGSSFPLRLSEKRGKDPSSAPPPQDDRAEARYAYGGRRRTPASACLRTGTRKPSHSRTAGRSPAYLQTEVQELSLLRAAAWGWICRPFPGGTICWAEPGPACRKKKVTGKSGFTAFRPPQPPGCNPQMIAKGNPMWGGRKKQKFCHFRGHAPGK